MKHVLILLCKESYCGSGPQLQNSSAPQVSPAVKVRTDQIASWHLRAVGAPKSTAGKPPVRVTLFTEGYKGKYHPLTGCHAKQPQAQKFILAAKLPGVPSGRRHGVLQGTKAGETRGTGCRNISIKEAESNEAGYVEAHFYLDLLSTWK